MRKVHVHVGQSFERVQQFLDANQGVLGSVNQAEARKQLDAAVARMRVAVDEQGVRTREASGEFSNRRKLEQVLSIKFVRPAVRFAKAQLKGVPTYAALTPSVGRLRGARLVNAARSLAQAAVPYTAQFTAQKFPTDFLAQLSKASEAVSASLRTTAESNRRRAGATQAIMEALQVGRAAVGTLDSLVSHFILGNVQLEAEWRVARRVTLNTGVRRVVGATASEPGQEVTARAA